MRRSRSLRPSTVAAVVLLGVLLGCHFWTRVHVAREAPLGERGSYPGHYAAALSLVGDEGFAGFELLADTRPEARPVRDFLRSRRQRLSSEELAGFLDGAIRDAPPLAATWRVLDMRLAAAIWSRTGIDWGALAVFHAGLSTFCALALVLVTSRIAGSLWAGLLAGLLLLASPYESQWSVYSHRDLAPLWFGSFGLAALFLLRTRCQRWIHLPWFLILAGAATLGLGWRLDALLMPVVVAVVLIVRAPRPGETLARRAAALLVFGLGCWSVWQGIGALGPPRSQSSQIGFHVAYYGEFTRANVLGYENSFQVLRDDGQTYQHCAFHAERVLGMTGFRRGGPEYGAACRALYLEVARYNLFNWAVSFPRFLARSSTALAPEGSLQSEVWPLASVRPSSLRGLHRWVLDPLTRLAPLAAAVGFLALAAGGRLGWRAVSLAAFGAAYAGVMFLVLPEAKHAGPILLPLYAFAGIGLWSLGVLAARRGRLSRDAASRHWPLRRRGVVLIGSLASIAMLLAWSVSVDARRSLVADVLARTDETSPAQRVLAGRQFFSVTRVPGRQEDPVGYLLEIRTGAAPGELICRHMRGVGRQTPARLYRSRHRLHPSQPQSFFVAALQGSEYGAGDHRSYVATVTLAGDAEIQAVRRVDLTDWRRPLFTSVFRAAEWTPGSPWLRAASGRRHPFGRDENYSTRFDGVPGDDVNELGLRHGESPEADRVLSELTRNPRRAWNRYRLVLDERR